MACGLATAQQQLPEAPTAQSSGQKPAPAKPAEPSPPQKPAAQASPQSPADSIRASEGEGLHSSPAPSGIITRDFSTSATAILTTLLPSIRTPSRSIRIISRRTLIWAVCISTNTGYLDAIKQFREAVRVKPNDADAHNNLGLALKRNGDLNGASSRVQTSRAVKSQDGVGAEQSGECAVRQAGLYRRHSALPRRAGDPTQECADAHEPGQRARRCRQDRRRDRRV